MKTDVIEINSQGTGFENAVSATQKAAAYNGLTEKETIQLLLCSEEMLSLIRSVTGETNASFWLESEGKKYTLHLTTKTVMDKDKRAQLLWSASSGKNEAAKGFLGMLRNALEEAMTSDVDRSCYDLPADLAADLAYHTVEEQEWNGYERSVLRRMANDIKIGIRGGVVEMIVVKDFT